MNELLLALLTDKGVITDDTTFKEIKLYQSIVNVVVQECINIGNRRQFKETDSDEHRVTHNNAIYCALSDIMNEFDL